MTRRSTTYLLGALILTLLAAAPLAAADEAAAPASQQTPACNQPMMSVASPTDGAADQAKGGGDLPDAGEQSVCNAQCHDGSYVTCWGTSCNAYDSSCSSNFRGYCYGTSTGYRYCPTCPGCSATASCPGGGSVSCNGSSGCFGVDGCYASCDGNLTWCPNPKYPCPI